MKKAIIVCILTCFCLSCFAQSTISLSEVKNGRAMFKAKVEGFVGKYGDYSYAILPMEGMNATDLYHKMMLGLNNTYMDLDKVVSKIENEAITINAYSNVVEKSPKTCFVKGSAAYYIEGFKYRLSFKFKDGKVRFDTPIVTRIDYYPLLNDNQKMQGNLEILGNSCDRTIGTLVNEIINKILNASYNTSSDDNW